MLIQSSNTSIIVVEGILCRTIKEHFHAVIEHVNYDPSAGLRAAAANAQGATADYDFSLKEMKMKEFELRSRTKQHEGFKSCS